MFATKPHHHSPPYHRRLLCEILEARTLLSVSLAQTSIGHGVQAGSPAQQQTLADLPAAAQASISSAIGQDQPAYHAASTAAGVTFANPANGFTAQLHSGALQVSAGSDTWDMSLVGLSCGGAVQLVGSPQNSVNGNRVDSNYGTVDEWYVNGPGGLEQGFTIPAQPQSNASGSLTVELALGGDLTGTLNATRDGIALTRQDGLAVLGYTGLTAYDATGKTLPATLEMRADGGHPYLLIHVDCAGAQGPISIDPFVQQAKINGPNVATAADFGYSLSISGNTLVVGAPYTVGGIIDEGAAYVFTESGSVWTQAATLTASDVGNYYWFGESVSISGNTVVVGADDHDWSQGVDPLPGAAYVFTEPASGWADMTQTAKLTAFDGARGAEFGASVSISGNTLVVGAKFATVGGNVEQGEAYVFTELASVWTQTAELTASDGARDDNFGGSVSINESGNTVLVGAGLATVGGSYAQGAAYVFTEPASGWADMTQTARLAASDGAATDDFGRSVSINESGNTVVVGAPQATVSGNSYQGEAYVFTESASGWADMTETAKLTASDSAAGDFFGSSVSISGDTVVVGAHGSTESGNIESGAANVFTEPASGWANMTQTVKLTVSAQATGDGGFGSLVSISGNTLLVEGDLSGGSGGISISTRGAIYVFTTPTLLTVTPADWTSAGLTLTVGSDGDLHVYTTGTTTDAVPPVAPASVSSIDITSPSDTTANLTIDSTTGNPIPPGGLNYSGAGGLMITGSGTVALSGPNTYTGGTTVSSGSLAISTADALPAGGSLTVGAGGTFLFDPSTAAANVTAAASTTPIENSPAAVSSPMADSSIHPPPAVFKRADPGATDHAILFLPRGQEAVAAALARQEADALAGLAADTSSSGNPDQKKEVSIQAFDAVLAEWDVRSEA